MSLQWYALHSKPNKEEALSSEVRLRGLEVFYPEIRVRPVNLRARRRHPYFPGYIFVHIDLNDVGFSVLTWMPYSRGLVSFGSEPSPVPDGLIRSIRQRVDQVNASGGEVKSVLRIGETVAIQDGPFAGYEAIFDTRLTGQDRVRVLIKLLSNKQIPLEISAHQIKPKRKR